MKTLTSWIRMAAMLLAVLCTATHAVLAQSTTQGGIAGTVFDSTDAVIPNATILIHNNGTNAEIKLQSDGSGVYKAPQLAPGTYTVTVSASGFSDVRSSALVVQVDQVTEFNPHLATGAESTVIEVTTQTPVLNFESSAFGGHLQNTEIENIPINNRRWSGLAITTPAV
ncbi:MAG: carboxypeptidase-like regulatory domain-containing protein, partial [Acidobacteriota bacterium]|nr:carboxypeptidase-like regulatory domain-containing protein [Acidobacteriota bacterium]